MDRSLAHTTQLLAGDLKVRQRQEEALTVGFSDTHRVQPLKVDTCDFRRPQTAQTPLKLSQLWCLNCS